MKKYPYSQMDNIVCVSTTIDEKKKQQGNKQHKNPLKDLFPWIQPRNQQELSNLILQESRYQQNQPFYIRLELAHSQSINFLEIKKDSDNFLKNLIQNSKMKSQRKQDKAEGMNKNPSLEILKSHTSSIKNYSAYIFTGIAKSSITSHEIFDTLFHTIHQNYQQSQKSNSEQDENSEMRQKCKQQGHIQVSNQIKLSWDIKHKSEEYFRFMNKAYQQFKKKYEKQLLPLEVMKAVAEEMFPYGKARIFKYFQGIEARQLDEKEYFNYFFQLFSNHTEQINKISLSKKQIENISNSKSSILEIFDKTHHLEQFDFQAYLLNQFKQVNISYQTFERMILHNKKRYNHIINNFPFKTRKQRVKLLKQMVNQNKLITNRISLVQLCGQFKQSSNESDQYLILQQHYEQNDPSNTFIVSEIIYRLIEQKQNSSKNQQTSKNYDKYNLKPQQMFTDIFHYFFYEQEYKPFRYITYDPQYLNYHSYFITPIIPRALQKMLDLDKLPKTAEQELLNSTPKFQINIYEKIQYLLNIHRQAQGNGKLGILCKNLSSKNSKILLSHDLEEKNQKLEQNIKRLLGDCKQKFMSGKGFIVSIQNIRLRLLQLAMMKYQIGRGKKIYMYDNKLNQPYNSSNLDHHRKIESILFILMIKIGIIDKISFIIEQDDESFQLRQKYFKIENRFIDFLKKIVPFQLKVQKDKINAEQYYSMPLSRYFQPVVYHNLIFSFRNKIYLDFLESKILTKADILIINQVHKIIIIKELLRIDKNKQHFEDKILQDFFSKIVFSKLKSSSNSEKNEQQDQLPQTIKSKTKIYRTQFKKIEQFCTNQRQNLQKSNQKINLRAEQEISYKKKLGQLTSNLCKLQENLEKILWSLFSTLYDSIAKHNSQDTNYLSLYYSILLYFCAQSPQLSSHLLKYSVTLTQTSLQLKKKIVYLQNILSQMILQQNE